MGIVYHNLMEDIVLQYVDSVMEQQGVCHCEICKSDVIAFALNHLPPRYVATELGRLVSKAQSYESQFHTDVITALSEAAEMVRKKPRHGEKTE